MSEFRLTAPLSAADVATLKCGDVVYLDGEIVTSAGFPTHQRLINCIEEDRAPPVDLRGACFFHMGSLSDDNGRPVYANPTTSTRFNQFMPKLIDCYRFSAVAGKGGMDKDCVAAIASAGCVYFSMIGGAAPLLTQGIKEIIETGWDDLIMQFRLTRFSVENFGPLTVAIDSHGNSIYEKLTINVQDRLPDILKELSEGRMKS